MNETWKLIDCAACGLPFADEDDWFARHDGPEGEDIHDECCTICKMEDD